MQIIVFVVIVLCITLFLYFDIYEHDDFFQSFFYTTNPWEILKTADHGRYFSWIYMKLSVHGTSLLLNNIHPNDNIIPKIIVGIDIALVSYLISLFITAPFQKKGSPFWYCVTFIMVISIYTVGLQSVFRYNQHFAYQSNLIFFFLAWKSITGYIVRGSGPSTRKELFYNSFSAFMLGVTAHFNTLTSIGSLLFLLFIYFIYKWYHNDFKHHIFNKHILIPMLFFIIGNILYFNSPDFKYLANIRTPIGEGSRLQQVLAMLPEFLPIWFNNVYGIRGAFVMLIGIAMAVISIILCQVKFKIITNKNNTEIVAEMKPFPKDWGKEFRVILCAAALFIGVGFFNGTLLYSGKSYYGSNQFWVIHPDLQVVSRLIFLAAVCILVGYLMVIKPKIENVVYTGALILCICVMPANYRIYKNLYKELYAARINWYTTEKIYRLYSLKEKTAILPGIPNAMGFDHQQLAQGPTLDNPIGWTGHGYILRNYPAVYYKDIPKKAYQNYAEHTNSSHYKSYVPYRLTNANIAFDLFRKEGGNFTAEELSPPVFGSLRDPDFVLPK